MQGLIFSTAAAENKQDFHDGTPDDPAEGILRALRLQACPTYLWYSRTGHEPHSFMTSHLILDSRR